MGYALSIRLAMVISSLFLLSLPVKAQVEEGLASYYHHRFHGRSSASGYIHDNDDFVAAHRTLPFGTFVRVTNLKNMRSVIVSIMDAAKELDFVRAGITRVRLEVVPSPEDLRILDLMHPKILYLPVKEAEKEFSIIVKK